jgi:hypothetical protein
VAVDHQSYYCLVLEELDPARFLLERIMGNDAYAHQRITLAEQTKTKHHLACFEEICKLVCNQSICRRIDVMLYNDI